jgi:hypothetical protein
MLDKVKIVKQAQWKTILRSQLKITEFNPRKITKSSADKLRKQIREDGLIDTLVVNLKTWNVVGGNQRIEQLDKIYKYEPGENDYQLNVQIIDVDEKEEAKINVRLNNPDASGVYDAEKLIEISNLFELDPIQDLNFDMLTYDFFKNEAGISPPIKEISSIANEVRETSNNSAISEKLRKIKKDFLEEQIKENNAGNSEYIENDDYILTIVFNSNQEKMNFMKKINKSPKIAFIKSTTLTDILKPEFA